MGSQSSMAVGPRTKEKVLMGRAAGPSSMAPRGMGVQGSPWNRVWPVDFKVASSAYLSFPFSVGSLRGPLSP